jgi:hypothetical protein
MSDQIRYDYALAENFSKLIFGAHIRYNVLFFAVLNRENDKVSAAWDEWVYEMKHSFNFSAWNEMELFSRLNVTDTSLRSFVRAWSRFAHDINPHSTAEIDNLIRKREIQKKGMDRAKLNNADDFTTFEWDWLGIGRLQYRWPNAKRLLKDVMEGLGEFDV